MGEERRGDAGRRDAECRTIEVDNTATEFPPVRMLVDLVMPDGSMVEAVEADVWLLYGEGAEVHVAIEDVERARKLL